MRGVGSAGAFGSPNFVDHFVLHFAESCPGPISLLTFMKDVIKLLPLQTVANRYKPFQTACRAEALAKAGSDSYAPILAPASWSAVAERSVDTAFVVADRFRKQRCRRGQKRRFAQEAQDWRTMGLGHWVFFGH